MAIWSRAASGKGSGWSGRGFAMPLMRLVSVAELLDLPRGVQELSGRPPVPRGHLAPPQIQGERFRIRLRRALSSITAKPQVLQVLIRD
jgi:hypothetical protein